MLKLNHSLLKRTTSIQPKYKFIQTKFTPILRNYSLNLNSTNNDSNDKNGKWDKLQHYKKPLILLTSLLTVLLTLENKIQLDSSSNYSNIPNIGDQLSSLSIQGDLKAIKLLVDKYKVDINSKHKFGWAPIHAAIIQDQYEILKYLIDLKVDVNSADTFKFPFDCRDRRLLNEIIVERNFFSESIRVEALTSGFTPLHYACFTGNVQIIQLLCDNNANPNLKDDRGYLPIDFLDTKHTTTEKVKEMEKQEAKALRKKFPLEQQLHAKIVGQVLPINAVASAIRRKENGWHDEDRPLVFLFLGSSGVGKTELAKQVANYLHPNNNDAFIRVDMSEFQTKHEVAKFVGSPPGYVGYEAGGQLTEKLSKCPNAVVLLDEVEKAHPDVLTVMLQVFDAGRLTDGKGITVDCRDAIFIMTSNLAQTEIADEAEALRREAKLKQLEDPVQNVNPSKTDFTTPNQNIKHTHNVSDDTHQFEPTFGGSNSQVAVVDEQVVGTSLSKTFIDQVVYPILRSHFGRDEFLGRISATLHFLPFSDTELHRIVEMELERWASKALHRHSITLSWNRDVVAELAKGYNLRYGARSIKHEVEARVVNLIANAHEYDKVKKGDKVHLKVSLDGRIQILVDLCK